jgi:16S rRNA (cytosine(967)-C(5))-methyltransferase
LSLSKALAVAVEALSWIEVEGLNERQAILRSSNQLDVRDPPSLRLSHRLVLEATRRQNLLDKLLSYADPSLTYKMLKAGPRSFARIYTYWTMVRGASWEETLALLRAGRKLLGWQELAPLELTFGRILGLRWDEAFAGTSNTETIALKTFHPEWFVTYCEKTFGRKRAIEILKANMSPPPTYIRINTLVENESKILEKIKRTGMVFKKVQHMKHVYRVLRSHGPLSGSEAATRGGIQVQDKSSCLTVLAAKPKPGEVVFDVCAAPGAKTSFLAELMHNRGRIYSFDISKSRMNFWKKEMERMNVKIAYPILADARQPLPANVDSDLVILDPPCSNSGTFAKTPSGKWTTRLSDFRRYSQIQLEMLRRCAERVRMGGRLVYSTCSISVEENEGVIETFLKLDPRFRLMRVEPQIGEPAMRGLSQCMRLYPDKNACNGYFVATLIRDAY